MLSAMDDRQTNEIVDEGLAKIAALRLEIRNQKVDQPVDLRDWDKRLERMAERFGALRDKRLTTQQADADPT